jgi:hypothetical protein
MGTEARNLARSHDGSVIHRASCRHARIPWSWADAVTDDELLRAKLRHGSRVCKVCDPPRTRDHR